MRVMLSVILADVLLIVFLVVDHDALGKVGPGMPWTLKIHVPIAVFTVVMYFVTAWTGWQLWRGRRELLGRMRMLDRVLVPARVLTLVTSLMVQFIKWKFYRFDKDVGVGIDRFESRNFDRADIEGCGTRGTDWLCAFGSRRFDWVSPGHL